MSTELDKKRHSGEQEGRVSANDVTIEKKSIKRPFSELRGVLKGKVWMAEDFDEPLEEMKEYTM